jgi:SNF2 family DNA or RNA helicase
MVIARALARAGFEPRSAGKPRAKTESPSKPRSASNAKPAPSKSPKPAAHRPSKAPPPVAAPPPLPPPLARIDVDIPISVELNLAPLACVTARQPEQDGCWFGLRDRFAHLALAQGFDELLCLPQLTGFEPLRHQIETVRKVLKQYRGRVLLADEVGLGKTIEACMVLKEYSLRGMADRVLVLTPASLVGQWREELESKFGLAFATTYDALVRDDPAQFWDQPRVVASIATARRQEHAQCLLERSFDLVIADEAHHLRDRASKGWKLVDALNKRFLLLLSATPVQNDLVELYNLLTLLKPGIFKTLKEFRAAYMTPGNPRQPANSERLRALMRGAMIRNTRAGAALKLPRRHATTIKLEAGAEEAETYAELAEAARRLAAEDGGRRQHFALRHLLGAAGSSPAAAAAAVARIAERNAHSGEWARLADRWSRIESGAKETALIELLRSNPAEKKLVFVHARETLEQLGRRLDKASIAFARFDGSLTGPQKDEAIDRFREQVGVLLCTQSGGEGRNMQFCNTLINFDVPWNPMAIEQRIGRIDRIGQAREVFVFNLVTRGTLEEQVLALLEEKISMFELVVGEVGAILGGLEEEREFPDLVLEAWLESSETGREQAFAALGAQLDAARQQHEGAKELDEKLFGEDFEAA